MKNEKDIVYSFTLGETPKKYNPDKKDDIIRIRVEKNNRGGKIVCVIFNLPDELNIDEVCSDLKKKCGTGGTAKEGKIEIQGDKREVIESYFTTKGFKTKRAGG